MLQAARNHGPIDHSPVIDGREAHLGIIRPDTNPENRELWPESLSLIHI